MHSHYDIRRQRSCQCANATRKRHKYKTDYFIMRKKWAFSILIHFSIAFVLLTHIYPEGERHKQKTKAPNRWIIKWIIHNSQLKWTETKLLRWCMELHIVCRCRRFPLLDNIFNYRMALPLSSFLWYVLSFCRFWFFLFFIFISMISLECGFCRASNVSQHQSESSVAK